MDKIIFVKWDIKDKHKNIDKNFNMNKINYQITVINLIKQIFKKIDSFYGNNYQFHVHKCDYFNIYIILVFVVRLFILFIFN